MGLLTRRRQGNLLILCYHGVSTHDEHIWHPELYISPATFRRRMQLIQDLGFKVLPLKPALDLVAQNKLDRPAVAITFDDGWQDFYSQALPILKEFKYSATVYQTTYYTVFNKPVFDPAASYLIWKAIGSTVRDPFVTGQTEPLFISSEAIAAKLSVEWRSRVESIRPSGAEKDRALRRLAESLGHDYDQFLQSRRLQLMNCNELSQAAKDGVDIQLHTHSHRMPLEKERFLREINRNRYFVETLTGKSAVHFCYPNGWHRPELGAWLAEAGVQSATTCDPGVVSSGSHSMYLPRVTDSSCVSEARFESWLTGFGLIVPRMKRWLTRNATSPSRSEGALAVLRNQDQSPVEDAACDSVLRPEPIRTRATAAGS